MDSPLITFRNVWEPRGVVTRFSGTVTGRAYLASSQEIACDARLDEIRFVIKDFTAATAIDIDPQMFDDLAVIRFGVKATNPGARIVLVGTLPGVAELAAMLQRPPLDGSHETRAFATMGQAREWIARQPYAWTLNAYARI